jgi:acetylcholinesterase
MQQTYDYLVGNTSACAHLVGSAKSLDCLRTAPFADINHALNVSFVGPWPPVLDHDFFEDYTANQLSKGNFLKVPVLAGTNTDEGTAFGAGQGPNGTGVNTDEEFRNATGIAIGAANTTKTVSDLLDEVAYLYPDVQAVGIPSLSTWPQLVEPGSIWAKEFGLQMRRTNAYFGDFSMHYTRRRASTVWSENGLALYSYRFDTNDNGTPDVAGATHFQEVR